MSVRAKEAILTMRRAGDEGITVSSTLIHDSREMLNGSDDRPTMNADERVENDASVH